MGQTFRQKFTFPVLGEVVIKPLQPTLRIVETVPGLVQIYTGVGAMKARLARP